MAFDPDKPRYSQSTFVGRFRHFLTIIDPTTLLTTDRELTDAVDLINRFRTGKVAQLDPPNTPTKQLPPPPPPPQSPPAPSTPTPAVDSKTVPPTPVAVTDGKSALATTVGAAPVELVPGARLWRAKAVRDAVLHPDTKEKIPIYGRMSAFVPMNIPIVLALLNAQSGWGTLMSQTANQTYNAVVNYANRNATVPISKDRLALSYLSAVGSSCSIAMGLRHLLKKATHWDARTRFVVRTFMPFTAVATAGALNVFLMRRQELSTGIDVMDANGVILGKSQIAAKKALQQTVVTRIFLPLPVLALPPLAMSLVDKQWPKLVAAQPRVRMLVELGVITTSLALALPAAIALFPQQASLPITSLEPHFAKHANTTPTVFFNKGL
jgi:tricarboxylate carrier